MDSAMIRHLATAVQAPVIAAAKFEIRVYIWDTEAKALMVKLDAPFDFGGERITLSSCGRFLFTASYDEGVLTCFRTIDGELIWERCDIRGIQYVNWLPFTGLVSCGMDTGRCYIFDPQDGTLLEEVKSAVWIAEDKATGYRFYRGKPLKIVKTDGRGVNIQNDTFATLSAAFGSGTVAFSEAGGCVRCTSIETGKQLWRYRPEPGWHVLELVYYRTHGNFYGVEWDYATGKGGTYLLSLDETNGHCERLKSFKSLPAFRFSQYDGLLYTHDGSGIDVRTGEVVKRLHFAEVMDAEE